MFFLDKTLKWNLGYVDFLQTFLCFCDGTHAERLLIGLVQVDCLGEHMAYRICWACRAVSCGAGVCLSVLGITSVALAATTQTCRAPELVIPFDKESPYNQRSRTEHLCLGVSTTSHLRLQAWSIMIARMVRLPLWATILLMTVAVVCSAQVSFTEYLVPTNGSGPKFGA
jgi:hypothetical protein